MQISSTWSYSNANVSGQRSAKALGDGWNVSPKQSSPGVPLQFGAGKKPSKLSKLIMGAALVYGSVAAGFVSSIPYFKAAAERGQLHTKNMEALEKAALYGLDELDKVDCEAPARFWQDRVAKDPFVSRNPLMYLHRQEKPGEEWSTQACRDRRSFFKSIILSAQLDRQNKLLKMLNQK